MFSRMIRALRLDETVFGEIESDSDATRQAALVVVVAALATAIHGSGGFYFLAISVMRLMVWWGVCAFFVFLIGTTLVRAPNLDATYWKLLRAVGFAMTPRVFRVFRFIPFVGIVIFYLVTPWQFAALVVAVQKVMGYESTTRTAIVVGAGFVPLMLAEPFLIGGQF